MLQRAWHRRGAATKTATPSQRLSRTASVRDCSTAMCQCEIIPARSVGDYLNQFHPIVSRQANSNSRPVAIGSVGRDDASMHMTSAGQWRGHKRISATMGLVPIER